MSSLHRCAFFAPCPLDRTDGVHGATAHAGPGTRRCKFIMCCARCGKKKGLQGVGSESEHSRAMRYVKWPSLLVPQTL